MFPSCISFTVTNRCNLRCKMCGQWGSTGYLAAGGRSRDLPVEVWKRLADEVHAHGRTWIGIRGGEPFLYSGIEDLLAHIKGKGLSVSLDSNGTVLDKHAETIVRLGVDQINLSLDGPERVHNAVRGMPDCFARIQRGVEAVRAAAARAGRPSPVRTIVFTISPDSYRSLAEMPAVARRLGVPELAIVPYYYFNRATGVAYEQELREGLACEAYSWRGFQRDASGVSPLEFARLLREFKANLNGIRLVPFMDFSEKDYREWFSRCDTPVGGYVCRNPWRLMDIQPNGDANFCVDFPDYVVGNVTERTIEELWNNERAGRFRARLEQGPLSICHRCGAKYMSNGAPDAAMI